MPIFYALALLFVLMSSTARAAEPAISNRPPSALEAGYLPANGAAVTVNPPPIAWLDEKGATSWTLQIARGTDFNAPIVKLENWPWLMYTHNQPLPAGKYSWRYRFTRNNGRQSGWSNMRTFSVPTTAPRFARPSTADLREKIPAAHPRMFLRPEDLPRLKAAAADPASTAAQRLFRAADLALKAEPMREPRPWTGGKWNVEEWRGYLREIGPAMHHMENLGFAWLLTGRNDYGASARNLLLHYSTWDPLGPSSMKINDEVGMPLLYTMARTYDWIYPLLSDADRRAVLDAIRGRGNETYARLRAKPYEQFVYNSHFGRMWHFLGEAGLAVYGEMPEAETWLNYATTIFYGWYPWWGDDKGGWSEGIAYWSSYNARVTWWLDLMRASLGIDGAQKPFFANVADFALYINPPGNPVAGFGDFSEKPQSMRALAGTIATFATMRQNSAWQWMAEQGGGGDDGAGAIAFLRSFRQPPAPAVPAQLPLLKLFGKAGVASFHSSLADSKNNIHVAMRASEFGNVSHSHNDQNAIVMAAYGEPLLVNTGTRDFYGSPFCKEYYWQTLSHNGLLIGGQGQQRGQAATAKIVAHGEQPARLAWVVGDATPAYGNLARSYRRWTLFMPDYGAVLIDEVQTTAPDVTLLFHGRAPFKVKRYASGQEFTLVNGEATLNGFVAGANLETTQTDHYPVPMHHGINPLFKEWHLQVKVPLPVDGARGRDEQGSGARYIVTFLSVSRTDGHGNAAAEGAQDRPSTARVAKNGRELRIHDAAPGRSSLDLRVDLDHMHVNRL